MVNLRKSVLFSVQQSATEVHQIDNAYLIGTAEELFAQLKGRRLLSDKDAKSHSITLRLFVYDIKPVSLFHVAITKTGYFFW